MEPNLVSTRRRLHDVAAFAADVARVQTATTLTIHEKTQAVFQQLEAVLARLAATGQLSEQVKQELLGVASVALTGYCRLHRDFGDALQQLLAAYDPPSPSAEEKIEHWWRTKFLPWWRDNSW